MVRAEFRWYSHLIIFINLIIFKYMNENKLFFFMNFKLKKLIQNLNVICSEIVLNNMNIMSFMRKAYYVMLDNKDDF